MASTLKYALISECHVLPKGSSNLTLQFFWKHCINRKIVSRINFFFFQVETVAAKVRESGNQDLAHRYMHIQNLLNREGLLSPQTLNHFVERPILRQRKQISQSFKSRPKSLVPTQKYLKTWFVFHHKNLTFTRSF